MKLLEFETTSPLFEMERDGTKPFTCRKVDKKDKRFRALSQWEPEHRWGIKIINPATGERFVRLLRNLYPITAENWSGDWRLIEPNWKILILGERVEIVEIEKRESLWQAMGETTTR